MKLLLIALLSLGAFSSFAGVLVNSRTNEEIVFTVDPETKMVDISGSYNGRIAFKNLLKEKNDPIYYGLSGWLVTEGQIALLPTLGTAIVVTGVADTVSAPFIALNAAIKNGKVKKLNRTLMKAIGSQQTITVKAKTFDRVLDYLLEFQY